MYENWDSLPAFVKLSLQPRPTNNDVVECLKKEVNGFEEALPLYIDECGWQDDTSDVIADEEVMGWHIDGVGKLPGMVISARPDPTQVALGLDKTEVQKLINIHNHYFTRCKINHMIEQGLLDMQELELGSYYWLRGDIPHRTNPNIANRDVPHIVERWTFHVESMG